MIYQVLLKKMKTEFLSPIQYYMVLKNDLLNVNQLLGRPIKMSFVKYHCLGCDLDKPIFRQGFCQSCFYELPQAADWIMKPELSQAHLGIEDRDLEYEKQVQLQPHIVYLANSSHVKVGVTRKAQVPTRWIDQGAHEVLEILEVPNRYLAGIAEVALKEQVADKTNWRTMLKNEIMDEDLAVWRDQLKSYIPREVMPFLLEHQPETNIEFPVHRYPKKPRSLNLSKTPVYQGVLMGIKGQYLIFKDDTVFNVRSNEGCIVDFEMLS